MGLASRRLTNLMKVSAVKVVIPGTQDAQTVAKEFPFGRHVALPHTCINRILFIFDACAFVRAGVNYRFLGMPALRSRAREYLLGARKNAGVLSVHPIGSLERMLFGHRSAALITVDALAIHTALEHGRRTGVGRRLDDDSGRRLLLIRRVFRRKRRGRLGGRAAPVGRAKGVEHRYDRDGHSASDAPEPPFPVTIRVQGPDATVG